MTISPTKLYKVGGVLVEGTRSEGGAFYDIKIVKTGACMRYLTKVFESLAKEVKDEKQSRENASQAQITG